MNLSDIAILSLEVLVITVLLVKLAKVTHKHNTRYQFNQETLNTKINFIIIYLNG